MPRSLPQAALSCALALGFGTTARAETAQSVGKSLSELLKAQTQACSDAGQTGDAATLQRYLDPDIVFTNETGDVATKKDLVDEATPPPANAPRRRIEVTDWALHQQGPDLATATFVDRVTAAMGDQKLVLNFRSTETWARRPDGWKLIVSHTMNVVRAPPPIALPPSQLDEYAGQYRLGTSYRVAIARHGDGLSISVNGAPPSPLEVEIKDVLFMPGVPNTRKLFQRDAAGHITGYINRRDGADLTVTKDVG